MDLEPRYVEYGGRNVVSKPIAGGAHPLSGQPFTSLGGGSYRISVSWCGQWSVALAGRQAVVP